MTACPERLAQTFVLRPFEKTEDYDQCVALQQLTWGRDFTECVPQAILRISQKVGGIAAGAFDETDRLVGFVFGVSGFRNGRNAHWSHMLAVQPQMRGTGVGTQLKALQRDLLLANNIPVAYWTYDPLVSGNAHLNINRLAARPVEYVLDMYGSHTGSELHSGLGTDRFIVEWELEDDNVTKALAGEWEHPADDLPDHPTAAVNLDDSSQPTTETRRSKDCPVYVAIPTDIQQTKRAAPQQAHEWRASTRSAFQWYLQHDYRVIGFQRLPSANQCYYILSSAEQPTTK